jgi:hypothetical protein
MSPGSFHAPWVSENRICRKPSVQEGFFSESALSVQLLLGSWVNRGTAQVRGHVRFATRYYIALIQPD